MKKFQIISTTTGYLLFILLWFLIGGLMLFALAVSDIATDAMRGAFIAAAIAVIASPFYLKMPNPKKIIISLVMTMTFALTFVLTFNGLAKYYSVFTTEKWLSHKRVRNRMIASLESQYTLTGMSENDVKELLGEPDSTDGYFAENEKQYSYCYTAGGWVYYYITFEDGAAVKAWKHID